MGPLAEWYRNATRTRFWTVSTVRVERLSRTRVHCFGEYCANTSRWCSDLGEDYKIQRHSVLDLESGQVVDGFERTMLGQDGLADAEFIALARRSDPSGVLSDLVEPARAGLTVQFRTTEQSDTQRAPPALPSGLRITRDWRHRHQAELLRDGQTVATFALAGDATADALRIWTIPEASRLLLMANVHYLWLEAATGKVLRRGRI